MVLPVDVQMILSRLEASGHSAYVVGGCVRDALRGVEPHDYDICTSAKPQETEAAFPDFPVLETGLQHGTVGLMVNHVLYEITTYRMEGAYQDNRHPDSVQFISDIETDLSRRDFTVNAMAYNPNTGLVDPFHGQEDLKNGLIRCVREPGLRFQEDALRILRAVRFSARCRFAIEPATRQAMLEYRHLLDHIAAERKASELLQILRDADYPILRDNRDIFAQFIPELRPTFDFNQKNPYHLYPVYDHMMHAVAAAPPEIVVRLALFLHDIEKPACFFTDEAGIGHFYGHAQRGAETARHILNRLRLDKATIQAVCELIAHHDMQFSDHPPFARRLMNSLGTEQVRRLITVVRCDKAAQAPTDGAKRALQTLARFEANVDRIEAENQCLHIRDLAVNGRDLMDLGIPAGARIGTILNRLLEAVLEDPERNRRDLLLKRAAEIDRTLL